MNTNLKIYLKLSNLKILNIFDKIFPDIFRSSCSSRICSILKIIRIRLITRFRVIIKSFFMNRFFKTSFNGNNILSIFVILSFF